MRILFSGTCEKFCVARAPGIMDDLCRKIEKKGLLIQMLDRQLDEMEEDEILSHMLSCSNCLAKMASVLLADNQLKDTMPDLCQSIRKTPLDAPATSEKKQAPAQVYVGSEITEKPLPSKDAYENRWTNWD